MKIIQYYSILFNRVLIHAALEDAQATLLEELNELLGLVTHDLAVLYSTAAQLVVELHGLVRGRPVLVLARVPADPEVDVAASACPGPPGT